MLDSPESIKCSICGRIRTAIADPDSGEIVCSNCGMVIAETNQDYVNPERHAFTPRNKMLEQELRLLRPYHAMIRA
jgi:transcription initiation factor TFIIIB Brf1 subunit/transcription initiation factor TFIIB